MGVFGVWQWVIVLAIVVVLFGGRGKISALMGDFGKGLKSFKKGIKDEDVAVEADANSQMQNSAAAEGPAKAEKSQAE